mgnify:CR=1 FL=1
MKIIALHAENVKKLKAVEIRPDPNDPLVLIKGDNGAGKSSCLDAIAYALGGKELHPPKVIREGAESAQVVLELDDLVVERRWTSNDKSYLKVSSRDGANYPSPQAMLNGLVGRLSFDPLAFLALEPKKQAEALRQLAGVDFTELDAARAKAFAERTDVNRDLERARAKLTQYKDTDPNAQPVDVAALIARSDDVLKQQREQEEQARGVADLKRQIADNDAAVERTKAGIAELEERLSKGRELLAQQEGLRTKLREKLGSAEIAVDMAPDLGADLAEVRAKLSTAEKQNEVARAAKARGELEAEARRLAQVADALTGQIEAVDQRKAKELAAAKLPVPGLSFTGEYVLINGAPLEQGSAAEKLKLSVAMGLALNPKLRVMLIRDGSLLDDRSLRVVADMAKAAGAQVWVERVDKGGVGIVIEDGEVASETKATPPQLALVDGKPRKSKGSNESAPR